MVVEGTVWVGRDNPITLELTDNRVRIDHSKITRVVLQAAGTTIDSDSHAGFFDWSSSDRLAIKLGTSGLSPGTHEFRLIVYDAASPSGLVWGDLLANVVA